MTRARCWRRSRRAEPARASHHRSPAAPRRRSCASCAPKSPTSLQSTSPTPLATRLCQGVPRAHRSRQVCQDRERTDAEYHWRGLSGERGTVREQRSFDARPHAARARHATLAVGASMASARSGHERSCPPPRLPEMAKATARWVSAPRRRCHRRAKMSRAPHPKHTCQPSSAVIAIRARRCESIAETRGPGSPEVAGPVLRTAREARR